MKTLMRYLLIALISTCPLIFSSCQTGPHMQAPEDAENNKELITSKLNVGGLSCQSCKDNLEAQLYDHESVELAEVDLKKSPPELTVKHYAHLSLDDIKKIIIKANYTIEK